MMLLGVILFFSISLIFLFLKTETIKKTHNGNVKKMEEALSILYRKQELLNKKVIVSTKFKEDFDRDFKLICDEIIKLQKIFMKKIFNQKNT
ncbi:hypothetical protein [Flavobacterium sp.]